MPDKESDRKWFVALNTITSQTTGISREDIARSHVIIRVLGQEIMKARHEAEHVVYKRWFNQIKAKARPLLANWRLKFESLDEAAQNDFRAYLVRLYFNNEEYKQEMDTE